LAGAGAEPDVKVPTADALSTEEKLAMEKVQAKRQQTVDTPPNALHHRKNSRYAEKLYVLMMKESGAKSDEVCFADQRGRREHL
jgi:hypothetical protein